MFLVAQFDDNTLAVDTMYISHRTWKNQIGTDLEVSSPLVSSHNIRRYYVGCLGKKKLSSALPNYEPLNSVND